MHLKEIIQYLKIAPIRSHSKLHEYFKKKWSNLTKHSCYFTSNEQSGSQNELNSVVNNRHLGEGIIDDLNTMGLSKSAVRKQLMREKRRLRREQKKAENRKSNDRTINFSEDKLKETDYYFENGFRKVYPYYEKFITHAKGRWVGSTVLDVARREWSYKIGGMCS